ncbi:hypothetical protein B0H11DRAFT_2290476, partial [Mycena galericulata]
MTAASLSPPPPLHHRQDHDAKTKRCGRLGTPGRPHAVVRGRHDSARRRPGGWTHFDSGSVALSSCRVGVVLVRKSECLWSSRRVSVPPVSSEFHLVADSRPTPTQHPTPTGTRSHAPRHPPSFAPRRQGPKPTRHHAHK